MKILIVDNEPNVLKATQTLLQQYCSDFFEEIEIADGVHSGFSKIQEYNPDLVFLDVEMDDGTGFDLLAKFKSIDFQVIFVTAHDKYAINAFRFSAMSFLLKPIDSDELMNALLKAKEYIHLKDSNAQYQIFKAHLLESNNNQDKKIAIKDSNAIHFVQISQILHCESDGPYTTFILKEGNKIVTSKNLKEYEELLLPFGFLRSHHSHLINVQQISRFEKNDGGFLIMSNGDKIPVSQRKKEYILQQLTSL